jgi:pyridoxamine 5'-phosphate oxidase family protein
MSLTNVEQTYLAGQPLGRLATLAPDGTPQVKPVGFAYNADLGTIDVTGFELGRSAKFRNVRARPEVAFVVDDVVGAGAAGTRFLEVRGIAEAGAWDAPANSHLSAEVIRIHPRRVLGWNIDPDRPGLSVRDVGATRPETGAERVGAP